MMPYNKINVGDVFAESLSTMDTYRVASKCNELIEVYPSYQYPDSPKTFWAKPTDKIFTHRVYKVKPKQMKTHRYGFIKEPPEEWFRCMKTYVCTRCDKKIESMVELNECPFCGFKTFFDEELEYILVQDYEKHWYVIPKDKEKKWNIWCNSLDEIEDLENNDGEFPIYAQPVGKSPSMITFKKFKIQLDENWEWFEWKK